LDPIVADELELDDEEEELELLELLVVAK